MGFHHHIHSKHLKRVGQCKQMPSVAGAVQVLQQRATYPSQLMKHVRVQRWECLFAAQARTTVSASASPNRAVLLLAACTYTQWLVAGCGIILWVALLHAAVGGMHKHIVHVAPIKLLHGKQNSDVLNNK